MAYDRINWENTPSRTTPLNAENLNQMDEAIDTIDEELSRVGTDTGNLKARMTTAEGNIIDMAAELNEQDTYAKGMGTKTLQHDTAISTLQGQVTQIISGGSPAGNEVTDIRVAENGTTYNTAGDAVRAQVGQMITVSDEEPDTPGNKIWIDESGYSEETQVPTYAEFTGLKQDLFNLSALEDDPITGGAWEAGGIGADGSSITTSSVIRTVNYIDVTNLTSLIVSPNTGYRTYPVFYNASKQILSTHPYNREGLTSRTVISLQSDVSYIRLVLGRTDSANPAISESVNAGVSGVTALVEMVLNGGSGLETVEETVNNLLGDGTYVVNTAWKKGVVNSVTGADVTTNDYLCSVNYVDVHNYKALMLAPDSGYKSCFVFFTKDKTLISSHPFNGEYVTSFTQIHLNNDAYYVRVNMAKNDSTPPDLSESSHIKIYSKSIIQEEVNGGFTIPDYYFDDDYLPDKIGRINELLNAHGANGTAFVFITDEHYEHPKHNATNSHALLRYVYDNTHLNVLFDGGDNADKSSVLWCDLLRDAWGGKIYHVAGNHEYMYGTDVMEQELYAMYDTYNNDQIGVRDRHYYYVDNPQEQLRYVILNAYKPSGSVSVEAAQSGYEQTQLDWLESDGLNVPDGWGIIIVLHGLYAFNAGESGMGDSYYATALDQEVIDVIEGYDGNGEIISVFSGHMHLDRVIYTSVKNIPVICTTCDANTVSRYVTADPRTSGTIGEQAFDVCILDKVERKWYIVRIGTKAYDGIGASHGDPVEERVISY